MNNADDLNSKTTDELVQIFIDSVQNAYDRIWVESATEEQLDKLGKTSGLVRQCDHEWVTWTGLHGTITDCTKCKQVKADGI
jgi:hypothetical protein